MISKGVVPLINCMLTVILAMTLALLLFVLLPNHALAGGPVNTCDEAALRAAMQNGGLVTFNCTGTILITAPIDVNNTLLGGSTTLTINGAGNITLARDSGAPQFNIFLIKDNKTLELQGLTVQDGGTAVFLEPAFGGAAHINAGATLNVISSTLRNNNAALAGAIFADGNVLIKDSTIVNNSATGASFISGFGGGLLVTANGSATIVNSTFGGNSAGSGAAISVHQGNTTILHTTIANNSATNVGGGIWSEAGSTVSIGNSIVAGNTATGFNNCNGIVDGANKNNYSNDDTCSFGVAGDDQTDVITFLGPLANNGGNTQTFALLDGNPAINAVSVAACLDENAAPLLHDQRGVTRPQPAGNSCDSGAFEQVPVPGVRLSGPGSINEGSSATYTVNIPFTSTNTITVTYTTIPGTATPNVDYVAITNTVAITAGASSNTFQISTNPDNVDEADETFSVMLIPPIQNGQINPSFDTVDVSILDDDDAILTINDRSITELDGGQSNVMTFTVTMNPLSERTVSVNYSTSDNTATAPADYVSASNSLIFNPGDSAKSIPITINGDDIFEGTETFSITLSSPSNAQISPGLGTGVGTINDNERASISIADVSVDEGVGQAAITLTIDGPSPDPISVQYATNDGTAVSSGPNIDFSPINVPRIATFPAGETLITVTVTISDDTFFEFDENFFVNLFTVTTGNADVIDNQSEVTIKDNDKETVNVTPPSLSLPEAGGSGSFLLTLSNSPTGTNTVQVPLSTSSGECALSTPGTAIFPGTATLDSTNWSTGVVITVTAVDDDIDDGNTICTVQTGDTSSGDPAFDSVNPDDVSVTIVDDDTAGVVITPTLVSVAEGGATGTYTVTLTSEPTDTVTINFNTGSQLGVINPLTFTPATWNQPQAVTVSAVDDSLTETSPHTGTITHSANSSDPNYVSLNLNDVTVTITDNDAIGIQVTESSGSTDVAEGGAGDAYQLVLNSAPTADVRITLNPDGQLSVDSPQDVDGGLDVVLLFNASNWSIPQTVNVNAIDDTTAEGTHTGVISHTISTSDTSYSSVSVPDVTVNITDNDGPVITHFIFMPIILKQPADVSTPTPTPTPTTTPTTPTPTPPPTTQPDLVVDSVTATTNTVVIVIRNTGTADVTNPFWVDLYVDPVTTPQVNQTWQEIASHGAAWGVTTTLQGTQALTLTVNDQFYNASQSDLVTLTPGTPIWVQVDSVDRNSGSGSVVESDETNNLFNTTSTRAANGTGKLVTPPSTPFASLPKNKTLPSR